LRQDTIRRKVEVGFTIRTLVFPIDLILPVALLPHDLLCLLTKMNTKNLPGDEERLAGA
jgi:hypothetical protein